MQAWVGSLDQQTVHMGASGSVVSFSPVRSTNSGGKSRVKSTSSGTVKSITDPKSKPSMSVLDEGAMLENVAIFLQLTQGAQIKSYVCFWFLHMYIVHATLLDIMSVHSACLLCVVFVGTSRFVFDHLHSHTMIAVAACTRPNNNNTQDAYHAVAHMQHQCTMHQQLMCLHVPVRQEHSSCIVVPACYVHSKLAS